MGGRHRWEKAKTIIRFILDDLKYTPQKKGICFNYFPHQTDTIYNANAFAATFLSRISAIIKDKDLLELAEKSFTYTASRQNEDGSWFYGEAKNQKWIDSFHTGYVLESLYNYIGYTGNSEFMPNLLKGIEFYKANLFLPDGTPKYYNNKIYPIDIQCAAQAIQTFSILSAMDRKYLDMAIKIAKWTIGNMQDESGYFYYRKYKFFVNKIPYMRWGESTMLVALAHLMKVLASTSTNGGIE